MGAGSAGSEGSGLCGADGVLRKLPVKVDLRGQCPAVYNQGELGSCTANAIGAAHQFDQMKQKRTTDYTDVTDKEYRK